MNIFASAMLFLAALGFWGHAESHYGFRTRVGAGLALVASACLAIYVLASIGPAYERDFHRSAMRLSGELLAKGQTQRVAQAIGDYNTAAATNSTYRASVAMWESLNRKERE